MTSPPADVKPVRAHRIVGIIGGMGPEATIDLMRRVIAKTPAQDDHDHVHLLVESNPKIPSRIAHLIERTGPDPAPELVRIAANLERAGADALAIPCNTAHVYAETIRRAVSIPLIDMVALTVARLSAQRPRRVGILASSAVHQTHLYAEALSAAQMTAVEPKNQAAVMELIVAVKRGDTGPGARKRLKLLAEDFSRDADRLLIACSELSVLAGALTMPFVDSLEVLADEIVQFAGATDHAAMR